MEALFQQRIAISMAMLLPFAAIGCSGDKTTYSLSTIHVLEVKLIEDGNVQMTFNTDPEKDYFCPGVNCLVIAEGLELSFVRSRKGELPKVDLPGVKVDRDGGSARMVIVTADGKPVYLRHRGELLLLTENRERKPIDLPPEVGRTSASDDPSSEP